MSSNIFRKLAGLRDVLPLLLIGPMQTRCQIGGINKGTHLGPRLASYRGPAIVQETQLVRGQRGVAFGGLVLQQQCFGAVDTKSRFQCSDILLNVSAI